MTRWEVTITLPLALPSAANLREHWATRHRRVAKQRAATGIVTSNLQWHGARERLGERLVDRISQSGKVVQLAAASSMRRKEAVR